MFIVLTPDQKNSISEERAKIEAQIDRYIEAGPILQAEIDDKTLQEESFLALYTYFEDIINAYHSERVNLDGFYVQDPILEIDIQNAGAGSGRLAPTPPVTNPVRIPQFDQTPLIDAGNEEDSELYYVLEQAKSEDYLQNGYAPYPTGITADVETASILTATSTSLDVDDLAMIPSVNFSAGDFLIVEGSGTLAVAVVTSVAGGPTNWTLGIDIRIAPQNDILIGANLKDDFLGFSDVERTAKFGGAYDEIMQGEISLLEAQINGRISKLNNQIAALQGNNDADLDALALPNAETSKTFLEAYLIGTDISDLGLASLAAERVARHAEVLARIPAITAAYSGGTINFLDGRYDTAKSRANTMRGTIATVNAAINSKNNIDALIIEFQEKLNDLNFLLSIS
jgi:hypothetical protein